MSLHKVLLSFSAATVAAAMSLASAGETLAIGIHDYRLQRTFSLPAPGVGSGGQVLMDTLDDGRILLLNGATVLAENAPQSGAFVVLGDIPGFAPGFGPSFLAVSPDGTRAAAGTNGEGAVAIFDTSDPTIVTFHAMQDFSGEWIDNRYLAVANFTDSAGVEVLDTATSSVTQVIANIGGASTDVTIDAAGNLYTGNGFDFVPGGSETGWIKVFPAADWQNALVTSTPLDFESDGIPVADVLTGYPMGFDVSGNLFVGGADFFGGSGDLGYAALVDAAAVADAILNPQITPPITPSSPSDVLRKFISPPETVDSFQPPSWTYNKANGEVYLRYAFGDGTVYVYAVPEPSTILLIALSGLLVIVRRGHRVRAL